jgi:N-acetylated-alpha-linked acidic dipeptidase
MPAISNATGAIDAVSPKKLWEHLEVFSTLFRDSGSEDEWTAARYIADRLTEYGVDNEILEFDSLISWPLEGKLGILDSNGNVAEAVFTRTRSFGAQTPPGGVVGELIFVPFAPMAKGDLIFSHRAKAGDYTGLDVNGKFVLTADGGPDGIRRAQERGAAGHIHIWPSDEPLVHEMIATSVWGTPTPESARRLPNIPTMGVTKGDGDALAAKLSQGPLTVRLESNVSTEWRRVPLVVGDIPGAESPDYLLVAGHIDSWYEGITDNATGDASIIEMARVLSPIRDRLKRGVRFAWWPGHSTGRYSGSTWYADVEFLDLRDHAIGFLMIDSPGVREATDWECFFNMAEVEHVTAAVMRDHTGEEHEMKRPLKAGDQSFWGIGIPSIGAFSFLRVDHPDRKTVGGCGGAYWWHTPEDGLETADAELLARDTRIYVDMTLRMVTPEVLPYDFRAAAQEFLSILRELHSVGGEYLDLLGTIGFASEFAAAAERLANSKPMDHAARDAGLKQVGRILNPVLYTIDGPFEVDPALQLPLLPGLAPMRELATLDPASDNHRFLLTKLVRQRNRTDLALRDAANLADKLATS